ncbi:polyprenyl synthetase family protein [Lottiidibacillus patelloidae]|uniref:polyprenyl synthetase family protein n=1 Tax=Lottiidibacillus patelloidae TaxID=2670334 RepID=UPI0038B8649D
MPDVDVLSYISETRKNFEKELENYVNDLKCPSLIKDAMLYSLKAGGKRLRPILMIATVEAFGIASKRAFAVASALEMIHTYSLIHDDLPAMDDDDMRRGNPTNHKVFGEANAILAGDALNTLSFEVIASITDPKVTAEMKVELIKELARAAGAEGMVGGQVADLQGEGKQLSLEDLEYIHTHKTGKLLVYAVMAGAILANASPEDKENLRKFAEHLGLAFQIQDDILDIEGDESKIGKPVGSDVQNEKSTYPKLLTLAGAKDKLQYHVSFAQQYLNKCSADTTQLNNLTEYVMNRDH